KHVERVLPAVTFVLVHQSLVAKNYKLRDDLHIMAERALKEAVKPISKSVRDRVLEIADDHARQILSAANCDNLHSMWVAYAHALLKAAMRGVKLEENIKLIAAGIETEMFDFGEDYGGPKYIDECANRMDNKARELGHWHVSKLIQPESGLLIR